VANEIKFNRALTLDDYHYALAILKEFKHDAPIDATGWAEAAFAPHMIRFEGWGPMNNALLDRLKDPYRGADWR
jgi:hypothetical protein